MPFHFPHFSVPSVVASAASNAITSERELLAAEAASFGEDKHERQLSATEIASFGEDKHERQLSATETASFIRGKLASPNPALVRMFGVVFAHPTNPLAKAEVIPQILALHYLSGKRINFHYAGFSMFKNPAIRDTVAISIGGNLEWFFSEKLFHKFRKEIEAKTTWRHDLGCDLLLSNARLQTLTGDEVTIDYTTTIVCKLEEMKAAKAFLSVGKFLGGIVDFVGSYEGDDPTWGFSNSAAASVAGSALKRAALSLLPNKLDEDVEKLMHFAVRDVARPARMSVFRAIADLLGRSGIGGRAT